MSKQIRTLIFSIILLFSYLTGIGQNNIVDSLEANLREISKPVDKIRIYNQLAHIYKKDAKLKSIYYLEKALKLAIENNIDSAQSNLYLKLARIYSTDDKVKVLKYYRLYLSITPLKGNLSDISKVYNNLGRFYLLENNFDSSEFYFKKSIDIKFKMSKAKPQDKKIKKSIGLGLTNLGSLYLNQSDYDKAIETYYQALKIFSQIGDSATIGSTYLNIGVIHYYYGDTLQAAESYRKAYKISKASGNKQIIASALTNLGGIEKEKNKLNKADSLFTEALIIRLEIGPENSIAGLYENLGIIAQEKENFDLALSYFDKSLQLKKKENNHDALASLYANLGNLYQRKKNFHKAEENMLLGLEHAKISNSLEKQIQIYLSLSIVYEEQGNYNKALGYYRNFKILDDSIHSLKSEESINLFKQKYQSSEKDRTISEYQQKQAVALLMQEKQRFNNRILGGLVILAIIISIFIVISINNRRKNEKILFEKNSELNQQKMLELVKEQEMKSVNSFISGQEKERARIASDLHDRLGSLLSTVKLHFSSIEPYFENEPELSENFSYAISLLDQSVTEVRSVSHNLAKEILTEFGLVGAIENLRDSINSASILKFVFVNTGFNLRLSYEIEIEIYRIIQELVTNVIKHANATELVIQFVADEETLSITVEDDGVGFDIDKVKKDGLGLHNIFNRTATIKGKYAIDSAPGAGTSFIFDFPITALTSKQQ